jgi:hypothetical protein
LFVAASVQKLGVVIEGNVVVCKKLTFDKLVHDTNAFVAIVVTDKGIVTEVRPIQPWNMLIPIVVSPFCNVMEVRPVQLWNAFAPIVVTELRITTEVRLVQFWNAFDAILVTLYVIPPAVIVLGIDIAPVALVFEATVASSILAV